MCGSTWDSKWTLNCNSEKKKFFTSWDAKFVMALFMLERLKQSFISDLKTIKVNNDLLEKENRMSHKHVFIHTMFKITIKVLMIGKSPYLIVLFIVIFVIYLSSDLCIYLFIYLLTIIVEHIISFIFYLCIFLCPFPILPIRLPTIIFFCFSA